ncbi:MAG TPA: hypothetical protein VI112_03650 [Bacteroidia bacterium]
MQNGFTGILRFLLQRYVSPKFLKWSLIIGALLSIAGVIFATIENYKKHWEFGEHYWFNVANLVGACFAIPLLLFFVVIMFRILIDVRSFAGQGLYSSFKSPTEFDIPYATGEKMVRDLKMVPCRSGRLFFQARVVITTQNVYLVCWFLQNIFDMQKGVGSLKPFWQPGYFCIPLSEIANTYPGKSKRGTVETDIVFKNGERFQLRLPPDVQFPRGSGRPM